MSFQSSTANTPRKIKNDLTRRSGKKKIGSSEKIEKKERTILKETGKIETSVYISSYTSGKKNIDKK